MRSCRKRSYTGTKDLKYHLGNISEFYNLKCILIDTWTMLDSILLVDDENLFHLVFEDACSLLDISLNLNGY